MTSARVQTLKGAISKTQEKNIKLIILSSITEDKKA